jgi:hypothetical protein
MTDDPFACAEIECEFLDPWTLRDCCNARCCWTYVRRREESAIESDLADQAEREERG